MDANGLRFWQLADGGHFPLRQHVVWDSSCRVLRLASERTLASALSPADALSAAEAALDSIPRAVDAMECVARWDAATQSVIATSYLPSEATVLPLEDTPSDLCAGHDGVLYAVMPGGIRLHDLRARWEDVTVSLAGFAPWRMAPAAGGGAWVLERNGGRIARLAGRPLRRETPQTDDYDGDVFRPSPENGFAPALSLLPTPQWAADERALAIATLAGGDDFVVLSWQGSENRACVRRWLPERACLSAPLTLQGANHAYSVVGLSGQRIALRVPGRNDAPAFDLALADANGNVMPLGEVYPLSDAACEAPFANGIAQPPQYPSGESGAEPLFALSLNNLARRGEAFNFDDTSADFAAWMIDSRHTTTVWNRLYAEASIPAHTGFVVWLASGNEPRPPSRSDRTAWQAHGFGAEIGMLDDAMLAPHVPRAAHEHFPSELPGHPGLLDVSDMLPERDATTYGLYSVLVQNSQQRVRKLSGRYLWVHVVLHGDGRVSPEIAALRAWGSRFSYADKYLPSMYRESLFGEAATAPGAQLASLEPHYMAELNAAAFSDVLRSRLALEQIKPGAAAEILVEKADSHWLLRDARQGWRIVLEKVENVEQGGPMVERLVVYRPQASPADFTARMLGNFEGLLTQLEARIAAAHLYSDPASVPQENLDWLGHWIGVAFDHALPEARRRDWLRAAPELARWHGTRNGLRLALDVATGGSVRGGEIIVIEDFRLRRILATLLGVDMTEANDPLLPGLIQSGNSIVGDTLVIGDQERVELMALYREEAASASEDAAVVNFYEKLAHRATVLVHREVQTQDFALIRRIVQAEAAAHVEVRVVAASWPLLVGISSLVGVDTYLAAPRVPRPVQVERSVLGMGDFVLGQPVLDPRLAGSNYNAHG